MIPGMPLNNRPFLVHTISSWAPDGSLGRGYDLFLEMGSPTYPVNVMVVVEAGVTISTYPDGRGLTSPPLDGDPLLWSSYWPSFAIDGELTPGDGTGFATGSFVLLVNRGRINGVGGKGGLSRDGFLGGGANVRFWGGGGGGGGGITQPIGASPGLGGDGQIGAPIGSGQDATIGADGTELAGGLGGEYSNSTGFSISNRDPTEGETGGDAIWVHSRVIFAVDNTDGEIWGGGGGGGGAEAVYANSYADGGAGGAPGLPGEASNSSSSGSVAGGAAGYAIRGPGTIVVHAAGDIRGSVGS